MPASRSTGRASARALLRGSEADAEGGGKRVPGGDLAFVEHRGEHSLGVGDFLAEDAAAGAWLAWSASLPVSAVLDQGCLLHGQPIDEGGEVGAWHPGQRGVGQGVGQLLPDGDWDAGADEVLDLLAGGETQGGRGDSDAVFLQEAADLLDRCAEGALVHAQHLGQHRLRAHVTQIEHGQ